MSRISRICISATLTTLLLFGSGLQVSPTSAHTLAPTSPGQATLAFEGTADDGLTDGKPRAFNRANAEIVHQIWGATIRILAASKDGSESWQLELQPPLDGRLKVGKYPIALSDPNPYSYGLNFDSESKKCTRSVGEFEIVRWTWHPDGYVEEFEVNFAQKCREHQGTIRGTYTLRNPAPQSRPELGGTISRQGRASLIDGHAGFDGTVSCSRDGDVLMKGKIHRGMTRAVGFTDFERTIRCSASEPTAWSVEVFANDLGGGVFSPGPVRLYLTLQMENPGQPATVDLSNRVDLQPDETRVAVEDKQP